MNEEFEKGFDEKRTKLVWDEIDGMYRKFMWNNYIERWVEV